mmetsp:Transcript_6411/g.7957  ORF Transcript_6411/g.7957 Transcript_6411/m.7957 type:complete len:303 (-) Transcript_6411:98-1006(-)|eukprot:CAMPEP_0203679948 /NCGR_PEP_ID=MMETSP0090-20130426/37593_1 /ASSEMBLY_ACC=CAM_ASM_001088 /TAXON_ID=426623 /ORGANISM="Chaetoceros affinis, Strain CCMP159" /LENGTH=302 /DNA_ID=CAMNT_0050547799 /DNA_START=143 /DNA_END=1051 /DNA_ORIENTATION=-
MCSNSNVIEVKKLALLWSKINDAAPKVYVPFTKFDIGITILSTVILSSIRLCSEYAFIHILNYNPNTYKTYESAAACTSILHAIVLCSGLWSVLRSHPYDICAKMEHAPKAYQKASVALIQMCTGYMIYDAIFMCKSNGWSFHDEDKAFLFHHIVTTLYMSQTRVLGVGHISAMALMFTGELSNPVQNGHLITKFGIQMKAHDAQHIFHTVHPFMEMIFAIVYFILRAFVGPVQVVHISYQLLFTKKGRENVSLLVSIVWSVMIFGIIIGSIPWTIESWDMICDGLTVKYDKDWDYGPRYEL